MKKEIRVIGIDDGPFDKNVQEQVLIVGTIFRGGLWLDGVTTTYASVDGTDATIQISRMINQCKIKPQLQAILLDGIAIGGFNVIDIEKLHKETMLPVIVIMRSKPELKKIKQALDKLNTPEKFDLIKRAGDIHDAGKIFFQCYGTNIDTARDIICVTTTRSYIPEPIRSAHLIASGLVKGESSGNA